jgi:hypothetical protein
MWEMALKRIHKVLMVVMRWDRRENGLERWRRFIRAKPAIRVFEEVLGN